MKERHAGFVIDFGLFHHQHFTIAKKDTAMVALLAMYVAALFGLCQYISMFMRYAGIRSICLQSQSMLSRFCMLTVVRLFAVSEYLIN